MKRAPYAMAVGRPLARRLMRDHGTQISMAAAGEPSENGYAERLIRTIKEEEVYPAITKA